MRPLPHLSRRHFLGWTATCSLPAAARGRSPRFVVQSEPSLQHVTALMQAALQSADFAVEFDSTPQTTEKRSRLQISAGDVHVSLMPITPQRLDMVRRGQLRMIPVPLERGLLGWRACLVLKGQEDKLAQVRNSADLRRFLLGQGTSWWDAEIYRAAGITTRELPAWRNGEFAELMQTGRLDIFPMGLEELLNFFLPHFQQHQPALTLDPHLLLCYPWFRCVWVAPTPSADDLYAALQTGFDTIARDGSFIRIWEQYRQPLTPAHWQARTLIKLDNPLYGADLIPQRYQHLLLQPAS